MSQEYHVNHIAVRFSVKHNHEDVVLRNQKSLWQVFLLEFCTKSGCFRNIHINVKSKSFIVMWRQVQ